MSDRDLPCTCGHLSGDHGSREFDGQALDYIGRCLVCDCTDWTAVDELRRRATELLDCLSAVRTEIVDASETDTAWQCVYEAMLSLVEYLSPKQQTTKGDK